MPTAKKTPSGRYKVRIHSHIDEHGNRHYKSFTADTKKEAEYLASIYKYSNEAGGTFEQRAERYFLNKSSVLSPSTIRSYKCMFKVLQKDYPSFCRKTSFNSQDLQKLINSLASTRSPKSVKNYFAFVSVVIGSNERFNVTLPQTIKPRYIMPNKAEFASLLDAVKGTELEIPVLLGSFCMMRRSEVCGLKMEDIDGAQIHIHTGKVKNYKNEYVEKTTKTTASDRVIIAPGFIIDLINEKGYITTLTPSAVSDAFHRVAVKLGLNGLRFHDLRHWGASYRHSALNIPTAHIQKEGGWSNAQTLQNIYTHALDDEQRRYAEIEQNAFKELYKK